MDRTAWAWVRLVGGGAILAVLAWRLGAGPFVHGLRALHAWSLGAAAAITLLTTVCSAWRWSIVAGGLGVDLPLPAAVAACYRSQFLNCALPGGVLGDVHRGVRHGRKTGSVGRGLRAVGWERAAGQVVQAVLTLVVLLVLNSPVRSVLPAVVTAATVGTLVAAVLVHALPRTGRTARTLRAAQMLRTARNDVRDGVLARRAWPRITLASVLVTGGHAGVFLIAAWTTGSQAPPARLLPLALLVLAAMAIPLTVGGWGPREGAAAWAFAAAGFGAAPGVAAATAYGVMALVATLPGAVVLAVEVAPRRAGRVPAPLPATPRTANAHG